VRNDGLEQFVVEEELALLRLIEDEEAVGACDGPDPNVRQLPEEASRDDLSHSGQQVVSLGIGDTRGPVLSIYLLADRPDCISERVSSTGSEFQAVGTRRRSIALGEQDDCALERFGKDAILNLHHRYRSEATCDEASNVRRIVCPQECARQHHTETAPEPQQACSVDDEIRPVAGAAGEFCSIRTKGSDRTFACSVGHASSPHVRRVANDGVEEWPRRRGRAEEVPLAQLVRGHALSDQAKAMRIRPRVDVRPVDSLRPVGAEPAQACDGEVKKHACAV
jgi:hypothetical protein